MPSTVETIENGALQQDTPQTDPQNLLDCIPENCNEIDDIINSSIANTSECELKERCAFYGVDGSGSKREMLKRLSNHEATALTVLDTFDPVGSNMESD